MNWLDRAEAKIGHLAIPGLPRIIVGFNALVFALTFISPQYVSYLALDPAMVKQGQVWRVVTFVFIPNWGPSMLGGLWLIFYLLYLLFIGSGLEQAMGAFKFNVYYFLGMAGVIVSSLLFGSDFGPVILNSTLLFAFARYYPETVFYLFAVLPVKVKWIAWLTAAMLLVGFVRYDWDYRAALLVCLVNYLVFFGAEHVRDAKHRSDVAARRQKFDRAVHEGTPATLHECTVCGRTEITAPYLDFRVAKDGREYCIEHLPKPAA